MKGSERTRKGSEEGALVHKDVDLSEGLDGLLDHGLDLRTHRQVAEHSDSRHCQSSSTKGIKKKNTTANEPARLTAVDLCFFKMAGGPGAVPPNSFEIASAVAVNVVPSPYSAGPCSRRPWICGNGAQFGGGGGCTSPL